MLILLSSKVEVYTAKNYTAHYVNIVDSVKNTYNKSCCEVNRWKWIEY